MAPRKKYDPDVWGPPPPPPPPTAHNTSSFAASRASIPASEGAAAPSSSSSLFQRHFANRTEVVGKDAANAQLGVKAAGAAPASRPSTNTALAEPHPGSRRVTNKGKATVRIVAPSEGARKPQPPPQGDAATNVKAQQHASASGGSQPAPVLNGKETDTSPGHADGRERRTRTQTSLSAVAQSPATRTPSKDKLPLIAPTHRALAFKAAAAPVSVHRKSHEVVVEVDMGSSESESESTAAPFATTVASGATHEPRRSSSTTIEASNGKVKCLLAPSALAAAAAAGGGGGMRRRGSSGGSENNPTTPLTHFPAHVMQRPTSAASTSLSLPHLLTPLRHQASQSLSSSPALSLTPQRTNIASGEEAKMRGPRALQNPKPPSSAPSPSLPARNTRLSRRSPASADHSAHPTTAQTSAPATAETSSPAMEQKPSYTPYTLDSYKVLMADVAAQKPGGLGPSDTDAQRAAREKRERARAYAKQAEKIARRSLAGASGSDAGNESTDVRHLDDGTAGAPSKARRGHRASGERTPSSSSASTASSLSATTNSSSSSTRSSSSTSTSAAARNKIGDPRATSRKKRCLSSALSREKKVSPSTPNAQEEVEVREAKRSISWAPPTTTATPSTASGPAFAVASVSRKAAQQARVRRARALAYAERVAQERQEQLTAAATEKEVQLGGSGVQRESSSENEEATAADWDVLNASERGDGAHGVTAASVARVTAEDRARRQRLMDLEAAHVQKRAAVESIRRRLRGGT